MLEIRKLSKTYEGKVSFRALKEVDLLVPKGQFIGVMGPSGSGKTTLLNTISTVDQPTSGQVVINGSNPYRFSTNKLARFRRTELGFVFQNFNLLDTLTVRENIFLPLILEGVDIDEMNRRLERVSSILSIDHILDRRTYEISGGQAQRTAIARAIIHQPSLLLADEPTGNLDSKSSKDAMKLFQMINQEFKITIMMVTHDAVSASYCDRIIFIKDGRLYNDLYRGKSQREFYENIIDIWSLLGGEHVDFS